jgi:hypothetical protein
VLLTVNKQEPSQRPGNVSDLLIIYWDHCKSTSQVTIKLDKNENVTVLSFSLFWSQCKYYRKFVDKYDSSKLKVTVKLAYDGFCHCKGGYLGTYDDF